MTRKQYEAKLAELQSELEDLKKYEPKVEPDSPPFMLQKNKKTGAFKAIGRFTDTAEGLRNQIHNLFFRPDDDDNQFISYEFMQIRGDGEFENQGFYLGEFEPSARAKEKCAQWVVVTDNTGSQVLTTVANVEYLKAQKATKRKR